MKGALVSFNKERIQGAIRMMMPDASAERNFMKTHDFSNPVCAAKGIFPESGDDLSHPMPIMAEDDFKDKEKFAKWQKAVQRKAP